MEEGERLSKKQSSMEGTIKKLRQQVRDLEAAQTQAASKLAGEESKLEAAVKARQQAEASLAASVQQHKAENEQQQQHYETLLARARSSQVSCDFARNCCIMDIEDIFCLCLQVLFVPK